MTTAVEPHLLLIAHAPLAGALRACALHVFADSGDFVHALDVQPDAAPEATLAQAQALLARAQGAPVLVLSDVQGATPCNVAQRLVAGTQHRLLAGANVPMLLRAIAYRHAAPEDWVQRALQGGQQGVLQIGGTALAPQNQNQQRTENGQDRDHDQQ